MRISATCFDGDLFSKHQRCFSRPSTVRVTDGLTRCFLPAAPSYWRRVPMNHPYSGAASYIYANEHSYSPVDPKPKDPYSNLPSFVPSPSSITSNPIPSPRRSHDTAWSTEGTYTRTQRPRHDDSPVPSTRPRGLSQPPPLIPLRVPVSHPHQQRKSSWADDVGSAPAPAPTNAAAAVFIVPPARSTSTLPASSARSTTALAPRMTPYAHDGDPLSLRRSAFVPYEPRPFERAEADRARARTGAWRKKIERRIRRAMRRFRRLMRFES